MKVESCVQPIQPITFTKMSQKMNRLTQVKQARTRSQSLSSEVSSILFMLILAIFILPAVGFLPSAASGMRLQHLIHTR